MKLHTVVSLAAAALLAACGGQKSGQVTVSAASTSGGTSTPAAAPATLPAGVQVNEVNVAVRELELEDGACAAASASASKQASGSSDGSGSSDDSEGSGDSDSEEGECEAEVGPFIAHLDRAALDALAAGKVPQVWSAGLPAGTYGELEVKLCAVDPASLEDPAQVALATAMQGATVVVKGTYRAPGAESAADFTISVAACAEIERHVQVTVDDGGAVSNLTLQVSLAGWFYDAAGQPIAPDTAAGAAAIAANIAASLDVFGDDDHDGHSDD